MTKQEAIKLMKEGLKVSHDYIFPNRWMTIENNRLILEYGDADLEYFFMWRVEDIWDEGYSIYENRNKQTE